LTRATSSMTISRKEESKHEYETKSKIIVDWMKDLLKEDIPGATLQDKLEDGVVLCKIANAIKPGCIRKFHRKPKMLMMKLENIAFFLAVAKSRFGVPQTSLFNPQDIHDKTDDNSNMLRVVTVLALLVKEGGYNISGLEDHSSDPVAAVTTDDSGEPSPVVEPTPGREDQEPQPDTSGPTPTPTETNTELEPQPDTEIPTPRDEPQLEPQPTTVEAAKPSPRPTTASSNNVHSDVKGSWYLQGHHNQYIDLQPAIITEILHTIHHELSNESKLSLCGNIETHVNSIQEKLLYSSDSELRNLCFEMGLGKELSDVPENKERKWYVEWILKYGRAK